MSRDSILERCFKLRANGTDVRTEIMAGLTTFMTMAYILAVNPEILSHTGMDAAALFTATALSAFIGTILMAFLANYPYALAPGMGLNAFFAFTVVAHMGKSWQFALTAVLIEGFIFLLLSLFKIREAIFDSIPTNLKKAVSVGIGFFIALIGATSAGLVRPGQGVIIALGDLSEHRVWVTLFGLLVTGVLLAFKVKGALLFGIIASTLFAIPVGVTSLPQSHIFSLPPSLAPIAFKFDFTNVFSFEMLIVLFSFLFVDIFDTLGTLMGVASKTKMLDEDGKLPRISRCLLTDSVATISGACLGTSTVTTFVESSAGVAEGGRTGFSSVITGLCFAVALFFAPLFGIIPSSATAPALMLVGLFMLSPIKDIPLDDYTESIPAFLTIVMMVFSYSIADGISWGMMSYVLMKVFTGKYKQVSITMYVLALLFLLRYIVL
ncbi:MAG: NCS2 family permease [Eubacteriales bacterium]|nr:NCS2 family permease [Eubacteriales bacterium]